MPALVDTCGWIEWLTDGVLAAEFEPWLAELEQVYVPTRQKNDPLTLLTQISASI